mmetsp:Transcript_7784/g.10099  ORF Transcript_7784/g.10099 Transcript_7784/m.10099 type:complete len:320 (-) Transcript_7784:171-1130(-)
MIHLKFDLKKELGMKINSNCVVGTVFDSQAKRLGVQSGWIVSSISEGRNPPIHVSNSKEILEFIQLCRNRGHHECMISFNTLGSAQTPTNTTSNETTSNETPLPNEMKNALFMAGAWFFLKIFVGKTANEWLSSILAFSICGVISSTVGFDIALFFGGALSTVMILKILEIFFGHSLYDLIVLGLICAYHTKPSVKSFDGKPMSELMATKKQVKAKIREEAGESAPKEPTDLLGQLWKEGKKFAKEVAANVVDVSVPIEFRDFYVVVVAEAKFSKTNVDENVFYIGCFHRWFNINAELTTAIIKAHSFAKKMSQPQPQQ